MSVDPDLAAISRSIQARHVLTPWSQAKTFPADALATAARRAMRRRQFAHAPVVDEHGLVLGIFSTDSSGPGSTVGERMRPLSPRFIVSADTPISDTVRYLTEEELILVLQDRTVVGFVTPSDLASAPARTHYYLLLAGLEMALGALVRKRFPQQDDAVATLSPSRREAQRAQAERLKERDEFVDDVACTSLRDLLTMAGAVPRYRELAGELAGGLAWGPLRHGITSFRNDVMHPVKEFARANAHGIRAWSRWSGGSTRSG